MPRPHHHRHQPPPPPPRTPPPPAPPFVGRHGNVRFGKFVFPTQAPKLLANAAVDPSKHTAGMRRELAPYLEQFSRYFSEGFLLEKLAMELLKDDAAWRGRGRGGAEHARGGRSCQGCRG